MRTVVPEGSSSPDSWFWPVAVSMIVRIDSSSPPIEYWMATRQGESQGVLAGVHEDEE